ncbi:hypothetical protein [Acidocella sp.]|nr:hypothetical protein [Acidocella sp.]
MANIRQIMRYQVASAKDAWKRLEAGSSQRGLRANALRRIPWP